MATWLIILVSGWIGFGLGMTATAYVFMTVQFMGDRIHIERNAVNPQDYLRGML